MTLSTADALLGRSARAAVTDPPAGDLVDASQLTFVLVRPRVLPGKAALARKRVLDVVVGTLLCLVAVPLIAVLAIAGALTLRCNPFFVQRRPGVGDKVLRVVKLRTLPRHYPAQAVKPELCGAHIPRFGAWLRRHHLDELPQLLEVVVGRMSLVGPRPRLGDAVEPVDPAFDRIRRAVRPGCSGLWQISVACDGPATGAPEFDLFYLRNITVRFDLWVLARTVGCLLGVVRAVNLDDVPRWVLPSGR